jgi:hypothetical protein
MNPAQLIIRCYVEKEDELWIAVCLDFCLATQGDSLNEAREKLENQIADYVYDALAGEDSEYASSLLTRKAPLNFWLRYYWLKFKSVFSNTPDALFNEIMPLKPA